MIEEPDSTTSNEASSDRQITLVFNQFLLGASTVAVNNGFLHVAIKGTEFVGLTVYNDYVIVLRACSNFLVLVVFLIWPIELA